METAVYHVSEIAGIRSFEPRPSTNQAVVGEVVWAVDEAHLHNYLFPRDCPRVTFYPAPDSAPEDVERLMGGSAASAVAAIESGWFDAARSTILYVYALPAAGFERIDPGAGYYVSRSTVTPMNVMVIDDPLGELLRRGVELRVLPSLWGLRARVISSTLQFSIIRMRNARPESTS